MSAKKYIVIGVAVFLIIVSATLTGESFTWTLSPFYILGFILILLWWSGTILVDAWRGKTEQVICNRGHTSIRLRDIITIPWQEPASDDVDREISLGSMTIMLTGGFDVGLPWGISWPGSSEAAVYIFPSIYHEKEQNNFVIKANLTYYTFDKLPSYLRDEMRALNLLPESKNRIHPTKTPIWYGSTSHLDGSATPENLRIERERKHENREVASYEAREARHYKIQRKEKEASEKQYIIGKPIKPIEEEE